MIVKQQGITILEADNAWHNYCKMVNIKNPWNELAKLNQKYFHKELINGVICYKMFPYSKEDEEKKKKIRAKFQPYRNLEDQWSLMWVYENKGYEEAAAFAKLRNNSHNDLMKIFMSLCPCDKGQNCSIFCHNFIKCKEEGFNKWSME